MVRQNHNGSRPPQWVIVAGGFHRRGGMDAANAALARHLASQGCRVHLVGYLIDDELRQHDTITVHRIARPLNSYFLGQRLLERAGRNVARSVLAANPDARVVVNGANCDFPDINWVHSVQHAWSSDRREVPAWYRVKHEIARSRSLAMESRALNSARLIIANSNRTRRDIIALGIPPQRVRTVYLGAEPHWKAIDPESRSSSRAQLGLAPDRPVAAFIGALGHDNRKGLDTLLEAWQRLCARPEWDAHLLVAGGGRTVDAWRNRIREAGLGQRVTILGQVDEVAKVLSAADLLVSPARYEPYGLNVHEALCCGVPAMVTASAGVAERYPAALRDWLIPDVQDVQDLVARLLEWRKSPASWKERVRPLALQLRARTWDQMAAEIVALTSNAALLAEAACSGLQ